MTSRQTHDRVLVRNLCRHFLDTSMNSSIDSKRALIESKDIIDAGRIDVLVFCILVELWNVEEKEWKNEK